MSWPIKEKRGIIPACDVESLQQLEKLVKETNPVKGVTAYKIGFMLALGYGLPATVKAIRKHSQKPIIYDHQKAATDIPETADGFMKACSSAGVDAVILFPLTGPETERQWIESAKKHKLGVIVGGEMTHKGFSEGEGGFISGEESVKIYEIAIDAGVKDFVVPGNKPERIKKYKELFDKSGVDPTLYSPGLVAQGGSISESGKAAGKSWHAIVGRGIYSAPDMRKAAEGLSSQL